jgi:hypothetical protein
LLTLPVIVEYSRKMKDIRSKSVMHVEHTGDEAAWHYDSGSATLHTKGESIFGIV